MQLEKFFTSDISLNNIEWRLHNLKPLTTIKTKEKKKTEKMFCASLESAYENDSTEKSCVLHPFE